VHPHPELTVVAGEQVDVVVAAPTVPSWLRALSKSLRRGRKSAWKIASSTGWSPGSSFLRPIPKEMRAKSSSMMRGRSRRTSSTRSGVRTALFPQPMS